MNGCGGLFSFKTFLIKSLDSSHIPDTIKNYTIPVLKKGIGAEKEKKLYKIQKKEKTGIYTEDVSYISKAEAERKGGVLYGESSE